MTDVRSRGKNSPHVHVKVCCVKGSLMAREAWWAYLGRKWKINHRAREWPFGENSHTAFAVAKERTERKERCNNTTVPSATVSAWVSAVVILMMSQFVCGWYRFGEVLQLVSFTVGRLGCNRSAQKLTFYIISEARETWDVFMMEGFYDLLLLLF